MLSSKELKNLILSLNVMEPLEIKLSGQTLLLLFLVNGTACKLYIEI